MGKRPDDGKAIDRLAERAAGEVVGQMLGAGAQAWPAPTDDKQADADAYASAVSLAISNGPQMARAYALAASRLCESTTMHPASKESARRLLRLALEHLT